MRAWLSRGCRGEGNRKCVIPAFVEPKPTSWAAVDVVAIVATVAAVAVATAVAAAAIVAADVAAAVVAAVDAVVAVAATAAVAAVEAAGSDTFLVWPRADLWAWVDITPVQDYPMRCRHPVFVPATVAAVDNVAATATPADATNYAGLCATVAAYPMVVCRRSVYG